MKAIEVQARILDCLLEELQHGNKEFINLLLELTGEIPFRDLRAAVYILSELGYILHNDAIPDNKGFFCKITKEGIRYHQDIFDAKEEPLKEKTSFFNFLKNIVSFFENAKTIITTLVTILVIVFGFNIQKIAHQFPILANLIDIEVQTSVPNNLVPMKKTEMIQVAPLSPKVIQILETLPVKQRKILETELKKYPLSEQEDQLKRLLPRK